MGTVIFHLLLLIYLLSTQISRVKVHQSMEIEIQMPDKEEVKKEIEEKEEKEERLKRTSEEEVQKMLRSIAVNENVKSSEKKNSSAQVEDYVNDILEELKEEGNGRYKAKRDKFYNQDSLQLLRDRKEQELDSMRSTFYSGESSVSYNLKDRYAKFLPIPVFKCENGGKVVIQIWVNPRGIVQKAVVIESLSESDEALQNVALDAARRSRFNSKSDAPERQKGTITYNFVKQ